MHSFPRHGWSKLLTYVHKIEDLLIKSPQKKPTDLCVVLTCFVETLPDERPFERPVCFVFSE